VVHGPLQPPTWKRSRRPENQVIYHGDVMTPTRILVATAALSFVASLVGSACTIYTKPADQPGVTTPPPAPTPEPAPAPPPPVAAYVPCAGKACGDACTVCDPADPNCMETAVVKQCNAAGTCDAAPAQCGAADVQPPPPAYDACAGKKCGDRCRECRPGDPKCLESPLVKLCHPDGVCKAATTVKCN
jgi:hypothetical protein